MQIPLPMDNNTPICTEFPTFPFIHVCYGREFVHFRLE